MILESWDLSKFDCIVIVAHRSASPQYDKSSLTISRSTVNFMVHSSNFLLESDWPMPACSDSLGLFYGSPKTETFHSLFAAAWDTRSNSPVSRALISNHLEFWMQGDYFQCTPQFFSNTLQCILLGFVKEKMSSWKVRLSLKCSFHNQFCTGVLCFVE
jgi:hypothetical protein